MSEISNTSPHQDETDPFGIAHSLEYLFGTKEAIRQAIIAKGVPVGTEVPFRHYADKIAMICPFTYAPMRFGIDRMASLYS